MKKVLSILSYLLFGMTLLPLPGELICHCFGYNFELNSITVYVSVLALLAVATVVISIIFRDKTKDGLDSVLWILLLPLALVNIFLFSFCSGTIWVFVCSIIAIGCDFFLVLWNGKYCTSKIIALVLTVIFSIPVGFIGFLCVLFADFGHVAVVQTVESPSRKYRAEVVDVDQGALGGDTLVEVYDNRKHFNLLIFTISKKPQRVYMGEWGAFKNMKINWKDDDCLIIDSKEYEIQ